MGDFNNIKTFDLVEATGSQISGFKALAVGLARTLRYPQVLAAMFAANLLVALVLAVLPGVALLGPARSLTMGEAAEGVPAWLVLETLMGATIDSQLDQTAPIEFSPAAQQAVLLALGGLLVLPLASWLPTAFLYGGVLKTYCNPPEPFNGRRFLAECWRWMGPFALLGAFQGLAFGVVLLPLVLTGVGIAVALGGLGALFVMLLVALLGLAWLAWMEFTRIFMVAGEQRNIFRGLGRGLVYVVTHPLQILPFYGVALLGLLGVHALFRFGLLPVVPLQVWLLVLVVQQVFVFLRLWARAVRLAGGAALVVQ